MLLPLLFAGVTHAESPLLVSVRLVDLDVSRGGVLRCAIYTDSAAAQGAFPMNDAAAMRRLVVPPAQADQVQFDVPPGTYAVSCAHDENENGRIDTNFVGIPKEGWATSRNVQPLLRGPTFRESAVQIDASTTVELELHY